MFDGDLTLPASGSHRDNLNFAPWHAADPCPPVNALMRARQAAPHLTALAEFVIPYLPGAVLASSSIKGEGDRPGSRVTRLEEALAHQWCSWNCHTWTNAETIDVDQPGWRRRLAELVAMGYPEPAVTVASPWKGSAHLTWFYERPILNTDPEQVRTRRGVRRGLDAWFDSCRRFSNRLTKNPWHQGLAAPDPDHPCDHASWDAYQAAGVGLTYHTEVRDLRRHQALDLLKPLFPWATERKLTLLSRRPTAPENAPAVHIPGARVPDARGSRLFHAAARATRRACTGKADAIAAIVARTAAALRSPAPAAEQAQIADNITEWMNTSWWGPLDGRPGTGNATGRRDVDHGAMTAEAADRGAAALAEWQASTVAEKRQQAGQRSRRKVADKATASLEAALAAVAAEGGRVTQRAVATRAGVSVETAKRRWPLLRAAQPEGVTRSNPLLRGVLPPLFPLSPEIKISPSAADLAVQSREAEARDKTAVDAYRAQAVRMGARLAQPEAVLPLPPDATAGLQEAYAAALAARRNLSRLAANRVRRAEAAERAAVRAAWHMEHAQDEAAWSARLSGLVADHAAAVEMALRGGGDVGFLDHLDLAHRSVMAAERRARDRARGEPAQPVLRSRTPPWRGPGPDTRQDLIDLAVPW